MINKFKFKTITIAMVLCMSLPSVAPVAAKSRPIIKKNPEVTTEVTTSQSTEETTEVTTNEQANESTTLALEGTTELTTKDDTKEQTEVTTKFQGVIEGSGQVSTVASQLPDTPIDRYGKPLTGHKLAAYYVVKNTFKDKWTPITDPTYIEDALEQRESYNLNTKGFIFDEGRKFEIKKYTPKNTTDQRIKDSITIPGSSVEIRYTVGNEWYMSANPVNTDKKTMFIDTDKCSVAVSVPAVYDTKRDFNTQTFYPELEEKAEVNINDDGTVTISYSFPEDTNYVGEIWYVYSNEKMADWNNRNHFQVLKQDFAQERRFSWDGYYFPVPSNYEPSGVNMLYRQPSNYSGKSLTKYGDFPAAFMIGYATTYICMENQNDMGYWETGPKSGWLAHDFNIGSGFYDTRFNTDFGENLLDAYKRYNNDNFLLAACEYAEFFMDFANANNYVTKSGGILVMDYGHHQEHINTHTSLNHQLAELNYLYMVYQITRDDKYRNFADKMLLAIEDTRDQWVLGNDNLNYALHYLAGTNPMIDYPYLTYNDLFITQDIHNKVYGRDNEVIKYLMECKMNWMKANNVTGYRTNMN